MPEFDPEKRILDLPRPLDAAALDLVLNALEARYPLLCRASIGRSILGQSLALLQMGTGHPALYLIGGQSGCDALSSALLCRFINEFCDLHSRRGRIFGYNLAYLAELRSICVLPMLNPDGVSYACHGVEQGNLLRERLLAVNGGSDDFTHWHANARGVELSRNYAALADVFVRRKQAALDVQRSVSTDGEAAGWCGEAPESEPESSALCRRLRMAGDAGLLLELRAGKATRLLLLEEAGRKSTALGTRLARLGGMPLITVAAEDCPLCAWAADELQLPAFILELDAARGMFESYAGIREMLFVAATLAGK